MEKHSRSLEVKNNKKCFILRNKKEGCVELLTRNIQLRVLGGVSKCQEEMIIPEST